MVEVIDRGIGIAPEDLGQIFEPFRRGSTATELDIPGVGLRLSATKRIVDGHGGLIEVESEPGRGAIFRLRLPAAGSAPEPFLQ